MFLLYAVALIQNKTNDKADRFLNRPSDGRFGRAGSARSLGSQRRAPAAPRHRGTAPHRHRVFSTNPATRRNSDLSNRLQLTVIQSSLGGPTPPASLPPFTQRAQFAGCCAQIPHVPSGLYANVCHLPTETSPAVGAIALITAARAAGKALN